jgi:predicted ABC-type transport system involved in lysophospholipase L1 biosynthesis ATPase subunit
LTQLNREEQVTLVLVTHDLDVAGAARRRIRLKDGKVLSDEAAVTDGAAIGVPVA